MTTLKLGVYDQDAISHRDIIAHMGKLNHQMASILMDRNPHSVMMGKGLTRGPWKEPQFK